MIKLGFSKQKTTCAKAVTSSESYLSIFDTSYARSSLVQATESSQKPPPKTMPPDIPRACPTLPVCMNLTIGIRTHVAPFVLVLLGFQK